MRDRLLVGDVLERLRELPDGCVHTCVTSPPYWGLRDYGVAGQIGLEPTVEAWVERMVEVFREVRRVLRDDGTLWLNLGDSYSNADKWGGSSGGKNETSAAGGFFRGRKDGGALKPKDLVGQPWRVAFALQADGWYLRSEIIWHKPNPMPESVTDRPTKSHEYVFLLSKSPRYFYDADAVREPGEGFGRSARFRAHDWTEGRAKQNSRERVGEGGGKSSFDGTGRNLRSVWTIPTQPYPEAHFATFPEEIPKRCILAGTSAKGACAECGAPWERIVVGAGGSFHSHEKDESQGQSQDGSGRKKRYLANIGKRKEVGWEPTCEHEEATTVPCLILDPFAGSGTTLSVAQKLGRSYIGIELSEEYAALARKRIGAAMPALAGLA